MCDYEKIIEGLRYCANNKNVGCLDCIYEPRCREHAFNGVIINAPFVMSDAADAIKELLAQRDKALKRLCEWCGVCSEETRKALECDDIAMLDAPRWISVEEQLPEKHKTVLFYIPWNKSNMIGWYTEDGNINFVGYGKCYDFSLVKPSHWRKLPEPPLKEEPR